jgi:hypothetical protein
MNMAMCLAFIYTDGVVLRELVRAKALKWNATAYSLVAMFIYATAMFFISMLLLTRFPLFLGFSKDKENNIVKIFILGAVSSGLLRFVVDGNSAEGYFLNSALIFGSLGIALAVNGLVQLDYQFKTWETLGLGVCSGLISYVFIEIWNRSNFQNGRWWQSHLQILVPFITAALTCAVAIAIRRNSLGSNLLRPTLFLFVVCLVGANTGMFILQSTKLPTYAPRGSIAADVDLESLNWLRNNSDESDVIATNRFLCPGSEPCGFDESSYLISAVANRQVLIEGPRFVAGGRPRTVELPRVMADVKAPYKEKIAAFINYCFIMRPMMQISWQQQTKLNTEVEAWQATESRSWPIWGGMARHIPNEIARAMLDPEHPMYLHFAYALMYDRMSRLPQNDKDLANMKAGMNRWINKTLGFVTTVVEERK